jgi:hydroxymethylglutaryl-CoA synthase
MGLLSTLAHFTILKRNSWKYIWFLSLRKRIKIKSFENHSTGLAICPKDVNLFETLEKSFEINFETYENCIKKNKKTAFVAKNEWILDYIEEKLNLLELDYKLVE